MNNKFYSNKEFSEIKDRINKELLRRGGFKWFNPLSKPKVGSDKSSPWSFPIESIINKYKLSFRIENDELIVESESDEIPNMYINTDGNLIIEWTRESEKLTTELHFSVVEDNLILSNPDSEVIIDITNNYPKNRVLVDDDTYTIKTSSRRSLLRTRSFIVEPYDDRSSYPNSSLAHITVDEMRNFIIGLSKINDINLFYGLDEKSGLAYRDPNGIEELLVRAENDILSIIKKFDLSFRIDEDYNLIMMYNGDIEPNAYIDENNNLIIEWVDENKENILKSIHFEINDKDELILYDMESRINIIDVNKPYNVAFEVDDNGDLIMKYDGKIDPSAFIDTDNSLIIEWNDEKKQKVLENIHFSVREDGALIVEDPNEWLTQEIEEHIHNITTSIIPNNPNPSLLFMSTHTLLC